MLQRCNLHKLAGQVKGRVEFSAVERTRFHVTASLLAFFRRLA